jgi:hypothetical protein
MSLFSVSRARLYGLSHFFFFFFCYFSFSLYSNTYNDTEENIWPLNSSCCYSFFFLLSTPKITQPFSLVGHDIYYYRTAVIIYTTILQMTINLDNTTILAPLLITCTSHDEFSCYSSCNDVYLSYIILTSDQSVNGS